MARLRARGKSHREIGRSMRPRRSHPTVKRWLIRFTEPPLAATPRTYPAPSQLTTHDARLEDYRRNPEKLAAVYDRLRWGGGYIDSAAVRVHVEKYGSVYRAAAAREI